MKELDINDADALKYYARKIIPLITSPEDLWHANQILAELEPYPEYVLRIVKVEP